MQAFLSGTVDMKQFTTRYHQECVKCKVERSRRNRVWRASRRDELKIDSFGNAPALYSSNIPKYSTMLLRAQHYARAE
eukprot:10841682-Karenia_brevis.AAC.1